MGQKGTGAKKSAKLKGAGVHAALVKDMIEAMAPFAVDCAKTAAMMGAATGKKPGNLSAAKTVMDFIASHTEAGGDDAVTKLLEELKAAGGQPSPLDEEVENAEPAADTDPEYSLQGEYGNPD